MHGQAIASGGCALIGDDTDYAAYVDSYGYVYRNSGGVSNCDDAVAPALHINLSSDLWSLAEADKPNIPNTPDCTHIHTELRNRKNPTCQAAGYSGDKCVKTAANK